MNTKSTMNDLFNSLNIGDGLFEKGTKVDIIGGPFTGESGTISDPPEYLEHSHYSVRVKTKGKYSTFRNVMHKHVKLSMP